MCAFVVLFLSVEVCSTRSSSSIGQDSLPYPRDALLARVLGMVLCLSVCLSVSVSHKSVFYRNQLNESGWFWYGSLFRPTPLCFKEIRVHLKIRVLLSGTFFLTLWT